uniref:Uncharacterized protein n=1 Tax=Romanomermis culicivorax TaxID=13658 RepID=A0A915LBY2_ROMCU
IVTNFLHAKTRKPKLPEFLSLFPKGPFPSERFPSQQFPNERFSSEQIPNIIYYYSREFSGGGCQFTKTECQERTQPFLGIIVALTAIRNHMTNSFILSHFYQRKAGKVYVGPQHYKRR